VPAAKLNLEQGSMALQIVWRNSQWRPRRKALVEQIAADHHGALYAVRNENEMKVFELILHRAA